MAVNENFTGLIFGIVGLSIPILLHFMGVYVIIKARHDKSLQNSQRLYYLQISIAVICICIIEITRNVIQVDPNKLIDTHLQYLQLGLFCTVYYGTMMCLTLDRFFLVHLNIQYPLHWSDRNTLITISIIWFLGCSLTTVLMVLQMELEILFKYIFPPLGLLFSLVVIYTYAYIFNKLAELRKSSPTVGCIMTAENDFTEQTVQRKRQSRNVVTRLKSALSTWLLVITFLFFMVIPDFAIFYYEIRDQEIPNIAMSVITVSRVLGFISDAFIYIFWSKPHKKVLIDIVQCKQK